MLRLLATSALAVSVLVGATACSQTARGVVEDTKENTAKVKGGLETIDDKTIDAGAIDVDTYADKKLVVLRGSVPTEAQKARAGQIAKENATGYTIDNRLAVVPR
jgi:osmotically-inducible protein OsmY